MIESTFHWIRGCILSSTHQVHLDCCKGLIKRFESLFLDNPECRLMVQDLEDELMIKETSISV